MDRVWLTGPRLLLAVIGLGLVVGEGSSEARGPAEAWGMPARCTPDFVALLRSCLLPLLFHIREGNALGQSYEELDRQLFVTVSRWYG